MHKVLLDPRPKLHYPHSDDCLQGLLGRHGITVGGKERCWRPPTWLQLTHTHSLTLHKPPQLSWVQFRAKEESKREREREFCGASISFSKCIAITGARLLATCYAAAVSRALLCCERSLTLASLACNCEEGARASARSWTSISSEFSSWRVHSWIALETAVISCCTSPLLCDFPCDKTRLEKVLENFASVNNIGLWKYFKLRTLGFLWDMAVDQVSRLFHFWGLSLTFC